MYNTWTIIKRLSRGTLHKAKRGLSKSSPVRSTGSRDSQTRGQPHEMGLKMSKIKVAPVGTSDSKKGEMMLLMTMMMMRWEPVHHKTEWQGIFVLGSCYSGLGIYVCIARSTYQTGRNVGGGRTVNTTHFNGPGLVHTSQLILHAINRVSNKHWFFIQVFLDQGRRIKPFFYSQWYSS